MKNSQKIPYLSDGEVYALWKYLNGSKLTGKDLLDFNDLIPSNAGRAFIAKFLNLLKSLGVDKLNGLTFHKDIYFQYNKTSYDAFKKGKEDNALDSVNLKAFNYLEKLILGDINEFYRNKLGLFDFLFYENKLNFMEFFEFSSHIMPSDRKILANFINSYITNFIDDNLQKDKKNFYCFDKQKKKLIMDLSYKESDYGSSFIFDYLDQEELFPGLSNDFLFIHTLISLEMLGYLTVEEIWIFDMDLSPEQQTENYKVKIRLLDKFFKEKDEIIHGKILKKHTQKEQEPKISNFDEIKSILHFNKKEIIISKTRNSNGHYLLKTLFKDKNRIWEFDEVAEDWNDEYKKDSWNRYYNA
ncbi:MAG: hypothetical protein WAV16_03960, partial [Candidatus Moraniibacteriota bacterium]